MEQGQGDVGVYFHVMVKAWRRARRVAAGNGFCEEENKLFRELGEQSPSYVQESRYGVGRLEVLSLSSLRV
jgi:hypothetical protein